MISTLLHRSFYRTDRSLTPSFFPYALLRQLPKKRAEAEARGPETLQIEYPFS